jgi:hypothetical protein
MTLVMYGPPLALIPSCNGSGITSAPAVGMVDDSAAFLAEVYQLADAGKLQDATDKIFETVDRCLLNEQFDYCNKLLSRIDPRRLPTALMRSFLTITSAAKDKLPARSAFHEQVFQEMSRLKGEEKAHRILGPLA